MKMKLSVKSTVDQWFNKMGKNSTLGITASILWLMMIGWIAFVWNLGNIGLIDETEPLFAEASRQMFITGDWITPFFNGDTRFDKPALIYWCQAIAYAIIGVNEWAVRLPSAIAAFGLICLAFYTVQWYLAKQDEFEQVSRPTRRYLISFLAAALMALNGETIIWARTGVSDMLLTGCMASALLCFFLGYAKGGTEEMGRLVLSGAVGAASRREVWGDGETREITNAQSPIANRQSPVPNNWYLACYVLIAGGILTKGPVGIVLPGLIVIAFLLYVGKLREVFQEMRLLLGILIILGLSVPWYALVIWRNGWNYINAFFGYHNLERFTEVVNGHSAPWYFYFIIVLLGFAPYSVYLPVALFKLKFWQRSHWLSQERFQQLSLFAGFWFVGVFGFFSIAVTKLPSYVLPLMPAAAILVALLWSDLFVSTWKEDTGKEDTEKLLPASPRHPFPSSFLLWSGWVNVGFLSVLATVMFNITNILGSDPAITNFHELIKQSGLPVIGGVIWLVCAVLVAGLLLSRRWNYIISVNALGFVAFLIFVLTPASFFIDRERQLPLRELSATIQEVRQPNEELVMLGFKKPSVVFYSQTHVNYFRFPQETLEHLQNQAAKGLKPPSLLLLAEQKKFLQMDLQPDDYKNLSTKGAYNLIRIPFLKKKKEKIDIS
ncbi:MULTISPECIES: glycosyltransferase family 39 protein [Nostoc]|uniref:Glycosyltransferase family 39 protein n=1 Tax=Nostoc paludosum FACHB-159 TaxID=2692908 RepID=A0ABR8KEI5_9NOSO|nr:MULTISPECIES: glycosyltransferase family 39 protein [Nostoc]MBD2679720.1 glycosyltransferase family 39 protein [Nostoc sp. FACHB-857]MBD2736710.1 glycosyltransferase family 39 protein [Nostoc paludosum FACHB-159]